MKHTTLYIISLLTILSVLFLIICYLAVLLSPSSVWFEYESLKNQSAQKNIMMHSVVDKRRLADLHYNDVLRCNFGEGYVYFSSFLSESTYETAAKTTYTWRYQGEVPKTPSKCYIRSVITATVEFGVEKKITIESLPFIYTP